MNEEIETRQVVKLVARWPKLLSIDQAAEYLSISPKTIRNGLGPRAPQPFPVKAKRFGKRVLFDINDLERYAEGLPYDV
jgi:hypothetical protein